MRTFRVLRTEFPLLLHHTKSASLSGHSLTHIKIYYSSDNFNESKFYLGSTEVVDEAQLRVARLLPIVFVCLFVFVQKSQ